MKQLDNTLYRKRGKRYVAVGPEFGGFPCNGLWLVTQEPHSKSRTSLGYLGEVPAPLKLASLMPYHPILCKALVQYFDDAIRNTSSYSSPHDITLFLLKQLAALLHEDEVKEKRARGEGDDEKW
jgi:hypothetical protein